MKEIGGYFEFEQLVNNEFYKDLLAFNSARNCLKFIIKNRKIKKIFLPYLLCDVIISACKGVEIEYYHIDKDFLPILDESLLNSDSYLYIINFYGLLNNKVLSNLNKKYKRIIVDNTHAFFQKPLPGIDTIYNCRKYFGVPDGAYLSTTLPLKGNIPVGKSKNRIKHLIGRYEETATDYYNDFKEADKSFDGEEVSLMSKFTKNLMGAIDYKKFEAIRTNNYKYLQKELKDLNLLNLDKRLATFMYPLYINNANEIRDRLIKNKIYIPILWPNVLDSSNKDSLEYRFANDILPIPIDQRYNVDDMKLIVDIIKNDKGV